MAYNSLQNAKTRLIELEEMTHSPVFAMSKRIVEYLEEQDKQDRLTIGGLRAALSTSRSDDNVLIEAAFTLTFYPFEVLDVQYRLYDDTLTEMIEIIDKHEYARALSDGEFYFEGELIDADNFHSRVFPVFINQSVNTVDLEAVPTGGVATGI
ncbi:TPA: hypothetical protein I7181_16075 [Vibrio vulnificus]|nr:hypothetical protein [Vibrio vulnificus]